MGVESPSSTISFSEIGDRAMYSARLSWEGSSRMRTLLSMLKPECFQHRRFRANYSFRSLRSTSSLITRRRKTSNMVDEPRYLGEQAPIVTEEGPEIIVPALWVGTAYPRRAPHTIADSPNVLSELLLLRGRR